MKTKKRFAFWKVFWVVLAIYILFAIIGILAVSIAPSKEEPFDVKSLLTWKHLLNQVVTFTFIVFYYYFSLNAFYRLIQQKKGTFHYIRLSVLISGVLVLFYVLTYHFISPDKKLKAEASFGLLLFSYIISTIFYICVSLLVSYFTWLRDERKQRKILEEQKMQLEVEKSQANLNFLKAQINPHFLHNTLNFLYAKSLPYSPELSEGILTLSDIMRYALSEGNSKDGKAQLKDEIEHVRNVIKINQLRFSNNLNVNFQSTGIVNGAMIIPFVLITLVENAFKHGDLKSTEHPIDIRLNVDENRLYFYCRNRKKTGPKEISTGVGLDNIKKRLELAYGNNYSLDVKDEGEIYTTELTINHL